MRDIQNESAYFEKIGVFGDADRKTADEYAAIHSQTKEYIEKTYAASGDIKCGTAFGQANLVIQGDKILTPAHMIYEDGSCNVLAKLSSCKVSFVVDGQVETIPVKGEVASGYGCSNAATKNIPKKRKDDWMILKLARPANLKIKPYQVNSEELVPEGSVVAVGKSKDFGANTDKGMTARPRHYGDCSIRDSWAEQGSTVLLGTDCDSSGGTSGGGLFTTQNDGRPVLVGMMRSSSENDEQIEDALKAGTINSQAYDRKHWTSLYVPVTGDLLKTLHQLGPSTPPQDQGTEI